MSSFDHNDFGIGVEDNHPIKRLSDLLPSDIIESLGFYPDTSPFSPQRTQPRRRATDPCYYDPYPIMKSENLTQPPNHMYYRVQLHDTEVDAFSDEPYPISENVGVLVYDYPFIRFGTVMFSKNLFECCKNPLEIVHLDQLGTFKEYIQSYIQIAEGILPTLLDEFHPRTSIQGIELVSYEKRAMMRIKLNDLDQIKVLSFVQAVMDIFAVAVEVVV